MGAVGTKTLKSMWRRDQRREARKVGMRLAASSAGPQEAGLVWPSG